jgi:hypothetical protein
MLFRIYVWEDELFMVWYKKGDGLKTAAFLEQFIAEGSML